MAFTCPKPPNEDYRLAVLESLRIFDTVSEARFDRIAELASEILDMPIALMPTVGAEELRFKAAHGLDVETNARDEAFCAFTIMERGVFVVPDAAQDARFADLPAVADGPKLRFYAGAPLIARGDAAIGALCVLDHRPHFDFDEKKQRTLSRLADIAMDEIRLHAALAIREDSVIERERIAERLAEAAAHAQRRFLSVLGHELRTPLTGVLGFSDILCAEMHGALGPSYATYAEAIRESGLRMLGTVDQLLTFASLENGAVDLQERQIEPIEIIERACRRVSAEAALKDMSIRSVSPDSEWLMLADPELLERMIGYLLDNAIKFSPHGSDVIVGFERAEDGGLAFYVEDNGIGIEADQTAEAMAAFMQLDDELNREFEGLGLGLPLTRMLVERHGGTLTIQSRQEGGTRAEVRMPPWRTARPPRAARNRRVGPGGSAVKAALG